MVSRNYKIKLSIIYIIVMLIMFVSFNFEQVKAGDNAGKTNTVKDHLDRKVEVPTNPKRILALNPNMMEIVFSLGVTPVGKVDEYTVDRPENTELSNISSQENLNLEKIYKLAPDLIIAHKRHHGQMLSSLEDTGAAVVFVDPSKDDPLIGGIDLVGKALNREDMAKEYKTKLKSEAADLQKKLEDSSIESALILKGGSKNIQLAQPHSFWGSIISHLGIKNIVEVDPSKPSWVSFDIETIIKKDPDIVIIVQPGFKKGNNSVDAEQVKNNYKKDTMWNQLTAVKENRMVILPINISPGKIKHIDALDKTAEIIYPDGFK